MHDLIDNETTAACIKRTCRQRSSRCNDEMSGPKYISRTATSDVRASTDISANEEHRLPLEPSNAFRVKSSAIDTDGLPRDYLHFPGRAGLEEDEGISASRRPGRVASDRLLESPRFFQHPAPLEISTRLSVTPVCSISTNFFSLGCCVP